MIAIQHLLKNRNGSKALSSFGRLTKAKNPGVYGSWGLKNLNSKTVLLVGLAVVLGGSSPTLHAQTPASDDFAPPLGQGLANLVVQPDRKILAAGTVIFAPNQTPTNICRVDTNGVLDSGFVSGVRNNIHVLAIQPDGRTLIGGIFTEAGGQPRTNLARLNADGTVDVGFKPDPDAAVWSMGLQQDGKIVVGGWFGKLAGQTCYGLGRLNADGTLDSRFKLKPTSTVMSLALQPDGKIIIAGNIAGVGTSLSPRRLARLMPDGTLDSGFSDAATSAGTYSVALQPDGKLVVFGNFTELGGQPRNGIGRLNSDGTLDSGFDPGADGEVYSVVMQADGKLLVAGDFTSLGGQPRSHIGRLNRDGSLDSGFNPGADNMVVCVALQEDGKVLAGGVFHHLGGGVRDFVGRLNSLEPALQALSWDGSTISWQRAGSSPEVWRTSFEASANGSDWIPLGEGSRDAGGWKLTGLSLQSPTTVRARGYIARGGYATGGSWFVESRLTIGEPSNDRRRILVDDGALGFRQNQFGFNFAGRQGEVVLVEASSDQLNWQILGTNTIGAGTCYFADPASTNLPSRFYRLRVP